MSESKTDRADLDRGESRLPRVLNAHTEEYVGMSRAQHSFKQRDVTRALRAAQAAGLKAYRVEIESPGKLVLVVGDMDKPKATTVGSWDDAIAELEQ